MLLFFCVLSVKNSLAGFVLLAAAVCLTNEWQLKLPHFFIVYEENPMNHPKQAKIFQPIFFLFFCVNRYECCI